MVNVIARTYMIFMYDVPSLCVKFTKIFFFFGVVTI